MSPHDPLAINLPSASWEPGSVQGERLADLLYRNIRDYVMFSDHGAAQGRLYPHELCQRFHATATPVRQALERLAAEGFIQSTPRRGFHIRQPSPEHVHHLWQVRAGLEVLAGELAIARLEQGEIAHSALDALHTSLQGATDNPQTMDGREHIERNSRFHAGIVALGGNPLLTSMYQGIQIQLLGAWVRRGVESWRGRVQAESDDHAQILSALRARDASAYRAAAQQHVNTSLLNALRDLQTSLDKSQEAASAGP